MSERAFVLVADQDVQLGESLADSLQSAGHACRSVASRTEAIESVTSRPPDVLIADFRINGDGGGEGFLDAVRKASPETEVLFLADPEQEPAVQALVEESRKIRAFDYILRPFEPDAVRKRVEKAAHEAITARQKRELDEQVGKAFQFEGMIGASESMNKVVKRIRKLAPSKAVILIHGESGTGKELIAQAIHTNSPRQGKPFKVINCAALSESLLESELFGHIKGAFTGAIADRKGILEAADGGTLFLDEIGDMPLRMQAKLLRSLESGEVLPVGSTDARFVDVRFVAATHRDLGKMAKEGDFREDLFYRLHGQGAIRIPPLRERREDIPLLVQHFIKEANKINGMDIDGIEPAAMRKMSQYSWPGNVRELRNVVELMVIEAEEETLTMADLPEPVSGSTEIVPVGIPSLAGLSMSDVEKLHIMNTLKLTGGNREQAARILGIGARTLYRKLKEYGINS